MTAAQLLKIGALGGCIVAASVAQKNGAGSMDSANFRLTKIGVVILGASDLDRSVAFYRDSLGLEVGNRTDDFVFLNAGTVTLALSSGLIQALGKDPGAVEVVFSVDHVRQAFEQLQERGVKFRGEPRVITGAMKAANFTDPDGHVLSIFGPE